LRGGAKGQQKRRIDDRERIDGQQQACHEHEGIDRRTRRSTRDPRNRRPPSLSRGRPTLRRPRDARRRRTAMALAIAARRGQPIERPEA
jgi:hypothetical protein